MQPIFTNLDYFNLVWIEIFKLGIKVKLIEFNLI